MTYPADWRVIDNLNATPTTMHIYPFCLREQLNASNPKADRFDGQEALVVFDGPATFVSPHWRTDRTRAAVRKIFGRNYRPYANSSRGSCLSPQRVGGRVTLINSSES